MKSFNKPILLNCKEAIRDVCYCKSNNKLISCSERNIIIWSPSNESFIKEKTIYYDNKTNSLFYMLGLTKNRYATVDKEDNPGYDYEGMDTMYTNLIIWNNNEPYDKLFFLRNVVYFNSELIQPKGKEFLMFLCNCYLKVICLRTYQTIIVMDTFLCFLDDISQNRILGKTRNKLVILSTDTFTIKQIIESEELNNVGDAVELHNGIILCSTSSGLIFF